MRGVVRYVAAELRGLAYVRDRRGKRVVERVYRDLGVHAHADRFHIELVYIEFYAHAVKVGYAHELLAHCDQIVLLHVDADDLAVNAGAQRAAIRQPHKPVVLGHLVAFCNVHVAHLAVGLRRERLLPPQLQRTREAVIRGYRAALDRFRLVQRILYVVHRRQYKRNRNRRQHGQHDQAYA